MRAFFLAGFAGASFSLVGCAGTWDTVTSRRFRDEPFTTTRRMISPEDPAAVLLADPPRAADERAAAMRRLKEPLRHKGGPEEQDAVLAVLERAAVSDPSPVLRLEAIGALSRFQDPRAVDVLMAAYRNAHGRKEGDPAPPPLDPRSTQTETSAGRLPTRSLPQVTSLAAPTGFPAEWVSSIRCRAADSLGRTNTPEAARFLAVIAGGAGKDVAIEGGEDRDVRLAAVRALGMCRQPEAVAALAEILKAEADKKDNAIIGRTHEGLVHLTGKRLPPDPQLWAEAVQSGIAIAPEPSRLEAALDSVAFWEKK